MVLKRTWLSAAALTLLATAAFHCSSSTPPTRGNTIDTGGTGGGSSGSAGGVLGGSVGSNPGGSGSNGGELITPGQMDPATDGGRPPKCEGEGDMKHCSCINVGSLGQVGEYGVMGKGSDDTSAFQKWLNTTSSASVKLMTTRVTLTDALLAEFDVLIIQALRDKEGGPYWNFSSDEITAFQKWVNNGGGVITMTGYESSAGEIAGVNQLLQFTGISYNTDDALGKCPVGTLANCYCWGNSIPVTNWTSGLPVTANITQVGAFHGRSIKYGSDAQLVAGSSSEAWAVTKKVGNGKVFVFADEWVTYTSQWLSTSVMKVSNMYDQCYMKSADVVFQVPQFWYNVIKWVNPTQCVFTINDPAIVH